MLVFFLSVLLFNTIGLEAVIISKNLQGEASRRHFNQMP